MIPHTSFYFIRHGETDWNKTNRIMGQTDIPLNITGLQQAEAAALLLKQTTTFERIASSPLSRALKTAQTIADKTGKPLELFDGLKEGYWGSDEGTYKIPGTSRMELWKHGQPQAGELYSDFMQRIVDTFSKILDSSVPTLIVSHGGVCWALNDLLQLPQHKVGNCETLFYKSPQSPTDIWKMFNVSELSLSSDQYAQL